MYQKQLSTYCIRQNRFVSAGFFPDDKSCDPKMAAICGMHLVSDLLSMENPDCRCVINVFCSNIFVYIFLTLKFYSNNGMSKIIL